jgi:hypothetical protein
MRKFIDNSVYKPIQQFRMLGCTKYGAGRTKIQENSWTLNDIVTNYEVNRRSDGLPSQHDLELSLLTYVKECKWLEQEEVESITPSISMLDLDLALDNIESLVPDGFQLDSKKAYGYRLKRVRASHCIICGRKHEADNARIMVIDNNVYFYCFRAPGKRELLDTLGKAPEDNKREELTHIIKTRDPKLDLARPQQKIIPNLAKLLAEGRNKYGMI